MATVEESNAELTRQVSLLRERNKTIQNIVDVEKDIVIKSKEIQTAAGAVKQQYESVKESVFGGIESFTTGIFGGPIAGLINTLTIGTLKRRKENAKLAKEKAEAEQKKTKEEQALREKSLGVMADRLMFDKDGNRIEGEFHDLNKEQVIEKIKQRELALEKTKLEKEINTEREAALAFFKDETKKAEENGGTRDNGDGNGENGENGGANGGEVVSTIEITNDLLRKGFGLNSPPFLETLVNSIESIVGSQEDLVDAIPTAEEKEEARKRKAAAAGGEVAEPKKEEKDGFGSKSSW